MDNQSLAYSDEGTVPPSKQNASPFQAYKECEETPFHVEGVGERWIQQTAKQSEMVAINEATGEQTRIYFPPKNIKVMHDAMVYAKLLRHEKLHEISPNGKLILLYIAFHLKMNKAEVEIYWSHVCKWCKITKTPYYAGMKDLLDRDVLAIKNRKKNLFWINPNYVFNGNRTKVK